MSKKDAQGEIHLNGLSFFSYFRVLNASANLPFPLNVQNKPHLTSVLRVIHLNDTVFHFHLNDLTCSALSSSGHFCLHVFHARPMIHRNVLAELNFRRSMVSLMVRWPL